MTARPWVDLSGAAAEDTTAVARWLAQPNGSLAVLAYEDVRSAAVPTATLPEFFQSAFEAGASVAGWDLLYTTTSWCPVPPDRLTRLTFPSITDRGAVS